MSSRGETILGRGFVLTLLCAAPAGLSHAQTATPPASSPPPGTTTPASQAKVAAKPATTATEEVVVTAEKRASTVQNTPLSITAVSGRQLQQAGITPVNQLVDTTPGLSLRSSGPGQTELEARGLSSSGGSRLRFDALPHRYRDGSR